MRTLDDETHSWIGSLLQEVRINCSQRTEREGERDEQARCMLGVLEMGNGWQASGGKYVLASSLTALLHPGHKASQRYLWSQLGHGGRRRSDRHWKPAERRQKKNIESPSVTKNVQRTVKECTPIPSKHNMDTNTARIVSLYRTEWCAAVSYLLSSFINPKSLTFQREDDQFIEAIIRFLHAVVCSHSTNWTQI